LCICNFTQLSYACIIIIIHQSREEKLYGDDIIDATSSFSYSITSDAPPVKSNNVSFMKPEQLPLDCRSILAVGKSHICYSVTQKKNLLRLIDTSSGEKVILRGHESAVLDLRFSPADSNSRCLCSVDAGSNDGPAAGYASSSSSHVDSKPHTIVWEKQELGDWKMIVELPLKDW
jgi:hypothetical protein